MFRKLPAVAIPGYAPWHVDTNDLQTVKAGLAQRLMRDIPKPCVNDLLEFKEFVANYIKKLPKARVMEFDEWIEQTSYNESRKSDLRKTHNELRGGTPTARQCSHIDTFVKAESYPEPKHARLINSRSDAFKVFSGPAFKAIENVVYALPEFVKHIPVPDRPAKILEFKKAGRRYYQTDFTAYESHFTPAVLDICECALYRHALADWTHVELLCSTLMGTNRLRTKTGLAARVQGRRMSGDMCTSLGNGFTNLMLAKFLAHKQGKELFGFVEGDDGLFATTANLKQIDYLNLGFSIKITEVTDPCKASFCGMIFASSNEIIKDPFKFLMNFGWTSSFTGAGPKIMLELLRAKALSCAYETPQCPIVGAFARFALNQTRDSAARFVTDGYKTIPTDVRNVPAFNPTFETRVLFESCYGVSVDVQMAVERAILSGRIDEVASLLPAQPAVSSFASNYVVVT